LQFGRADLLSGSRSRQIEPQYHVRLVGMKLYEAPVVRRGIREIRQQKLRLATDAEIIGLDAVDG
jgi:DNA-directed RNA polymerase subunit K/omega